MLGKLEGKVALVTGATRGVGRGIVKVFAGEGARVVFTGRNAADGESLASAEGARGHDVVFVRADSCSEDDVRRAVTEAVRRFGKLTTLVNNYAPTDMAGTHDGRIADLSSEQWREMFSASLDGFFFACRYAVPEIVSAGGGSVINIGSLTAERYVGGQTVYSAAKAAINSLTRSIAGDYGPSNVRCNCLLLGFFPTENPGHQAIARLPQMRNAHILERSGLVEDVGRHAAFLASDDASFITAGVHTLDGGMSALSRTPDVGDVLAALEDIPAGSPDGGSRR